MVARGMPTFARTGRERLRHHIMETFGFSISRERTGFVAASPRRSVDQRHQGERTLRSRAVGLLQSEDIANAIVYAVTQPLRVSVNEILIRPTQHPV
jgi:NADP-dependent 3-hydroxy acid dehydrogenase YdfG